MPKTPKVDSFKDLQEFIDKIDDMKKNKKMDLSSDQDLSIAVMNLVSIEEHFFFSGAKTGKTKYYDLIQEVRKIRQSLLMKLIPEYEGEVWCISKHLLAAAMRIYEVGTKQLGQNKKKEAYELFQQSYDVYSLFWGVNMKLIDIEQLQRCPESECLEKDTSDQKNDSRSGLLGKLGTVVKKVIDCCIE